MQSSLIIQIVLSVRSSTKTEMFYLFKLKRPQESYS